MKLKNLIANTALGLALMLQANASAEKIPSYSPNMHTVKNFLATAMQPVGKTLYIWGGGWNEEDTAAGESSKHIGVWPEWEKFFNSQDSDYNFCDYAIANDGEAEAPIPEYISLGLDCSGYRGWVLSNVFQDKDKDEFGYVFPHAKRVSNFVDNNWGTAIEPKDIKDFKPGDIMDKPGHTYIVIGRCDDGSIVFVHSSPPGVHICGTVTPDGNEKSDAVSLSKKYMKKYYAEYDKKFSKYGYMRGTKYLTEYKQLRWNVNDGDMKDPEGYTEMTPEEVLKDLFGENKN